MARIIVDTNVLFPFSVMDLLLALSEHGVHTVVWTDALLDEWERVIVGEQHRTPEAAAAITAAIRSFFADSKVELADYEHLVDEMPGSDADDHHHSAAAGPTLGGHPSTCPRPDNARFGLVSLGRWSMSSDAKLSDLLSEFARTLVTDFPIQGILDHLVVRIVDVLPITGAGVTLIAPGRPPRYVAASGADALRYEQLQSSLGEGPCVEAYNTGEAVSVPDLASDERYSHFSPAAYSAGLAAVFTFPLRHGDELLGALDLYCDAAGQLSEDDLATAQTLADVAAAYLINAQAREDALSTSDRFHYTAMHDPLTGLPNRLLLLQRLDHAGRRAQRSHTNAAILFADLDRFKQVNDVHGHRVGDQLLVAVAQRLVTLIRPGDTLARVSGDEFVFLCEDLHTGEDIQSLARRVRDAFSTPFDLGDIELRVTASVGMAYAGPGEEVSDRLVAKADAAMYAAKRQGGDHNIMDLRDAVLDDRPDDIEHDLRAALSAGDLELAYQPIVDSRDGRLAGVEALLRWEHPTRGPVPPMSMVIVAELTGLINPLGAWVLERACTDRAQWLAASPLRPLDVSVNVSARQLINPDFVPTVVSVLERTAMPPTALVLEVTENIFIEDADRAMGALDGLAALGVRLALDDFGTGYSSLSYLRQLPVDIVKIDQSFIADIGRAPTGGAIVEAVTNLAHVLGLIVTAEGVETQTQQRAVADVGCDFSQGYLYSRPVPATAIAAMVSHPAGGSIHLPLPDAELVSAGRSGT